jgi:hypothetical protein
MNKISILIIVISVCIIFGCAYFKSRIEGLTNNNNIILIGDSILNNSNYVPLNKAVADILKTKTQNVFNFAKDGATIQDCYSQLDKIPLELNNTESYIFISVGGNDILNKTTQLDETKINSLFEKYMELVKSIRTKFGSAKITLLNLYLPSNPRYQSYKESIEQWNQLIDKNSSNIGEMYYVIDLYSMLNNPNDFTYDIEPSESASEKIANVIYLQN